MILVEPLAKADISPRSCHLRFILIVGHLISEGKGKGVLVPLRQMVGALVFYLVLNPPNCCSIPTFSFQAKKKSLQNTKFPQNTKIDVDDAEAFPQAGTVPFQECFFFLYQAHKSAYELYWTGEMD